MAKRETDCHSIRSLSHPFAHEDAGLGFLADAFRRAIVTVQALWAWITAAVHFSFPWWVTLLHAAGTTAATKFPIVTYKRTMCIIVVGTEHKNKQPCIIAHRAKPVVLA